MEGTAILHLTLYQHPSVEASIFTHIDLMLTWIYMEAQLKPSLIEKLDKYAET